jgi:glycosyltransferase involved in cell wall biosynthesis
LKNNGPKVSVITVCYNAGHLLSKTINSVLEQSYQQLEYIIIDGSSTDNTIEVKEPYAHKIYKFISEPDSGLYDAMNKGIKQASGDLILFLNAGDYFVSKTVVEFTVSKMNLKAAELFFGRIVWNDPRTKDIVLSDHSWCNFTWNLKDSNFPHPATFYKRKLFETIGYFDLSYPIAADYEWNVRALVSRKISFQYVNIITTVFFADGISNNALLAEKKQYEINKIDQVYYKPLHLHNFMQKKGKLFLRKVLEKVISKTFDCRLSRIYY